MQRKSWCWLIVGLLLAANAYGAAFNQREQQAFMEASQSLTKLVLCSGDVWDADDDVQALAEASACFNALTTADVAFISSGITILGQENVLDFFVNGLGAQQTNVTILVNNYLVTDIDVGGQSGDDDDDDDDDDNGTTGEIEIAVWLTIYRDVVFAGGPLGNELGPQYDISKNIFVLRADEPGEWKVQQGELILEVGPEPRPQYP